MPIAVNMIYISNPVQLFTPIVTPLGLGQCHCRQVSLQPCIFTIRHVFWDPLIVSLQPECHYRSGHYRRAHLYLQSSSQTEYSTPKRLWRQNASGRGHLEPRERFFGSAKKKVEIADTYLASWVICRKYLQPLHKSRGAPDFPAASTGLVIRSGHWVGLTLICDDPPFCLGSRQPQQRPTHWGNSQKCQSTQPMSRPDG